MNKPSSKTRLIAAAGAAVLVLAACGGDDDSPSTPGAGGGGPMLPPLVAGTDVPVAATTDYQAATDFVLSIVMGGTSETAEPIVVGDVTLATSETAPADERF